MDRKEYHRNYYQQNKHKWKNQYNNNKIGIGIDHSPKKIKHSLNILNNSICLEEFNEQVLDYQNKIKEAAFNNFENIKHYTKGKSLNVESIIEFVFLIILGVFISAVIVLSVGNFLDQVADSFIPSWLIYLSIELSGFYLAFKASKKNWVNITFAVLLSLLSTILMARAVLNSSVESADKFQQLSTQISLLKKQEESLSKSIDGYLERNMFTRANPIIQDRNKVITEISKLNGELGNFKEENIFNRWLFVVLRLLLSSINILINKRLGVLWRSEICYCLFK